MDQTIVYGAVFASNDLNDMLPKYGHYVAGYSEPYKKCRIHLFQYCHMWKWSTCSIKLIVKMKMKGVRRSLHLNHTCY